MDYSKTVHLPKTSFSMKADLPRREPQTCDWWEKNGIYEKMVSRRKGAEKFILHDGPPYANGHIHMGHALNKILKDIIVKSRTMGGFFCPYVPGWDCHGLPIEHQLMKEMKKDKHNVERLEFRKKAADFAKRFVQIQKEEFKRLGVFGDWERPYLTLTPSYEGVILKTFRELLLKGFIYRSKKPVLWCARCETALAEAEVEYEEKQSPSVYVKFPAFFFSRGSVGGKGEFDPPSQSGNLYALIWTTTPWTLPSNVGLMFHPRLKYVIVHIKSNDERWIIAENLVQKVMEDKLRLEQGKDYYKEEIEHSDLPISDNLYERPFAKAEDFSNRRSKGITSLEVSGEDGTGIVHIAPGHGDVDYAVGHVQFKLPILSPVDDSGRYTDEVGVSDLKGLTVMKEGNKRVLEMLKEKNLLVHEEKITHSYPHCWRCKNPVIFRATPQWFLSVEHEDLRKKLLEEIERVEWVPDYGKNRIRGMVEQRPDWCLSRQRLWGTPIPVFYCRECGDPLLDDQAIGMVEELVGMEGSDVWFREEPGYFIKLPLSQKPFKCGSCGCEEFVKENDILDVWFDSGVSHEAVLKGDELTGTQEPWKDVLQWPCRLYLEGSDQHRGWFQTSLIPSVALRGKAPYAGVLTHGFIVDGAGKKMSKSLGNVIAPEDILKDYGADILRLWVASSDYREDIRLSRDILKGVAENYRKMRNTFRYLLGNTSDFDPEKDSLPYSGLKEIDRWVLHRLTEAGESARKGYDAYQFHKAVVSLLEFCSVDCSSFYFDVLKDRLYTFAVSSMERRSAQTVLHLILSCLTRLFAPILSFTCEEVWQEGKKSGQWSEDSAFLLDFPEFPSEWKDPVLDQKWNTLLNWKEKANLALESARQAGKIGSSLEARLVLKGGAGADMEVRKTMKEELPSIFIVSQVDVENGKSGEGEAIQFLVEKAQGRKCARCWRYEESVGLEKEHETLCLRCVEQIRADLISFPLPSGERAG